MIILLDPPLAYSLVSKQGKRISRVNILKSANNFARRIVKECSENRFVEGTNLWVFSLLAKLGYSGKSVETLIRSGHARDAKLIVRAMFETTIDINYILKGPMNRKSLEELAQLEIAVDEYKQLEFECKRGGLTVQQALKKHHGLQGTVERYRKAKQHEAFKPRPEGVSASNWPKLWSKIKLENKREYLELGDAEQTLAYTITHLGDSAAHSRFTMLKDFVDKNEDGTVRILNKPRLFYLYSDEWVAFEATLCLLRACDRVVDSFDLDEKFTRSIERLLNQLRRAVQAKRPKRIRTR